MKKQIGRPKKADKRTKIFSVHVTEGEFTQIKNKATLLHKTTSAFARNACLSTQVLFTLNDEDRTYVRQLISMSTNLNTLAKNSHTQGFHTLMQENLFLRDQINSLINKIRHA